MDPLDGLNAEQRRAAEAVRGPVCILAGAGSGKTTTITRRIAQQVATAAFAPAQIMAVTFTDKAAGELRARLAALGVSGVRASTFHSAALRQLRHFAPAARSGGSCRRRRSRSARSPTACRARTAFGRPATLRPRSSGRRTAASDRSDYREAAAEREPPIPLDLMHRVFRDYERRKASEGMLDFEDLLERTVQPLRARRSRVRDVPRAVPRVHGRRVPGREPAAADVARPLARRPRRPLRRRRRLPVDLRVHRCRTRASARRPRSFPEHDGGAARGELPLDPAGARVCEPAGAQSRRCREGAALRAPRWTRAGGAALHLARRGRRGDRRADPQPRLRARGRGDPRTHERPADRLRGASPRRRHSVPGLVAARARRRTAADAPARAIERRGGSHGS